EVPSSQWLERARILPCPANADSLSGLQPPAAARIAVLDDELLAARDRKTRPENIAHINEFDHLGFDCEPVADKILGRIDLDAFRTDRDQRGLALLPHIDGRRM